MATDPVCQMWVDEEASGGGNFEYEGQIYFFCDPECRSAFETEPEKYLGNEPTYDIRMFMGDM